MRFLAPILVTVILVALAVVPLVRTVRDDGWGHRPPPPTRAEHGRDRAW